MKKDFIGKHIFPLTNVRWYSFCFNYARIDKHINKRGTLFLQTFFVGFNSLFLRTTLRMSARLFACSIRLLARLYFSLFCALNTGSLHLKLRSFISIRSVSADKIIFIYAVISYLPLFYFCALAALRRPCAFVCANAKNEAAGKCASIKTKEADTRSPRFNC